MKTKSRTECQSRQRRLPTLERLDDRIIPANFLFQAVLFAFLVVLSGPVLFFFPSIASGQSDPTALEALEPLFKQIDSDENWSRAFESLVILRDLARKPCIEKLSIPTVKHRNRLILALGRLYKKGDSEIEQALCGALRDKDEAVRTSAAALVGHHQIDKGVPILLKTVQEEKWGEATRFEAAYALGAFPGTESLPGFRALVQNRSNSTELRAIATSSLGRVGHKKKDVATLLQVIANDESDDISIRTQALYGLGCSQHGSAAIDDILRIVEKSEERKLTASDGELRKVAFWAISTMSPGKAALPVLSRAFKNRDKCADIGRSSNLIAIGKIGADAKDIIPFLLGQLVEPELNSETIQEYPQVLKEIISANLVADMLRSKLATERDPLIKQRIVRVLDGLR